MKKQFIKLLLLSLLFLVVAIVKNIKIGINIGILLLACEIFACIIYGIYISILLKRALKEKSERIFNRAKEARDEILKALEEEVGSIHMPISIKIGVKSIIDEEKEKCEAILKEYENKYEDKYENFCGVIILPEEDKEACILGYLEEESLSFIEWRWTYGNQEPEIKFIYDEKNMDGILSMFFFNLFFTIKQN